MASLEGKCSYTREEEEEIHRGGVLCSQYTPCLGGGGRAHQRSAAAPRVAHHCDVDARQAEHHAVDDHIVAAQVKFETKIEAK